LRGCVVTAILVLVLVVTGCPSTPPPGNGNGNGDPPGSPVRVVITIVGQCSVDDQCRVEQTSDDRLVTLTAVAEEGWEFARWSGADVPDPSAATITVNVDDVPVITASFVPADADGDGVPDDDDDCPDTPDGELADATGCAPSQRDTDGDGVTDEIDECANTPSNVIIDEVGCPVSAPGTPDTDGDGVPDDIDQCPDTPSGMDVDPNGCAADERDNDGDGVTDDVDACPDTPSDSEVDETGCADSQLDSDGDDVTDDLDQCPDTPARVEVDPLTGCPPDGPPPPPPPTCGDGVLDAGEECDPPNGVTCDESCRLVAAGTIDADDCVNASAIAGAGAFRFDNALAVLDGPAHRACHFFREDQIDRDVWACWTAPCSATIFVQTCGLTAVDTKIAVYEGCDCPTSEINPVSCNDDLCDTQTLATFEAVAGQSYLVRVGTFPGELGGPGAVSITCGAVNCPGVGECFSAHATPGCDDEECCERTCSVDPFCCDVEWDNECATRAAFECTGSFLACAPEAGDCSADNGTPGCDDTDCCNAVCAADLFCCSDNWDDLCACESSVVCDGNFDMCGPGAGSCTADNSTPGCENADCCAIVCAEDPFCCCDAWDPTCADEALILCPFVACGDPGSGGCFTENTTPGCDDAVCCEVVCTEDRFCCDTVWDQDCADAAAAEAVCR
jgi:hypothetical protein